SEVLRAEAQRICESDAGGGSLDHTAGIGLDAGGGDSGGHRVRDASAVRQGGHLLGGGLDVRTAAEVVGHFRWRDGALVYAGGDAMGSGASGEGDQGRSAGGRSGSR